MIFNDKNENTNNTKKLQFKQVYDQKLIKQNFIGFYPFLEKFLSLIDGDMIYLFLNTKLRQFIKDKQLTISLLTLDLESDINLTGNMDIDRVYGSSYLDLYFFLSEIGSFYFYESIGGKQGQREARIILEYIWQEHPNFKLVWDAFVVYCDFIINEVKQKMVVTKTTKIKVDDILEEIYSLNTELLKITFLLVDLDENFKVLTKQQTTQNKKLTKQVLDRFKLLYSDYCKNR